MSDRTHPAVANPDWKRIRRQVLDRDGHECQECGDYGGEKGSASLHVHHITPVSDGGSDEMENLTTLCEPCHREEHRRTRPMPDSKREARLKILDGLDRRGIYGRPVDSEKIASYSHLNESEIQDTLNAMVQDDISPLREDEKRYFLTPSMSWVHGRMSDLQAGDHPNDPR